MPPQPVRHKGTVQIQHDALLRHKELAAALGYAIALWSYIDSELGAILAYMLKGDRRPAIAMYGAFNSFRTKLTALNAAAKSSLDHADLRLFKAVIKLVERGAKKRDMLAHWVWGQCPEIKDALILIDPDAVLEHNREYTESLENLTMTLADLLAHKPPDIDPTRAFIYRTTEFDEIIQEFQKLDDLTFQLAVYLGDEDRTEESPAVHLRERLLHEPLIQQELRNLR
jgi:hypothetical protein